MPAMRARGFTVVEISVSVVVAAMVVLGLVPLLVHLFSIMNLNMATARQVNETQQAVATISGDMQIMNSLLGRPLSNDTAWPAGGGWTFRGAGVNARNLILRVPATTAAYQNPARSLVYNSKTGTCGDNALPLYNTVVYYLQSQTLYRRTILDTNATPCAGQTIHQKTSCQSGCAEKDVIVATGVTKFAVDYFTQSQDTVADNTIYNSTTAIDMPTTKASAKVTLSTQRMIAGSLNNYEVAIRETKIW